jgi:hypothetical protein
MITFIPNFALCTNLNLSMDTPSPHVIPAVFAHLAHILSVFSEDFIHALTRLTCSIDSLTTSVRQKGKGTIMAVELACW